MSPPPSLEAKIVVLGSQSVGKTSLVHRYVQNSWIDPRKVQSTVGASFLTTKVNDPESGTTIRLQIWDTAGQERFRSISRLYYRGANAAILCYDITSKKSFDEMGIWLKELRDNCGTEAESDIILHVVGTKGDAIAADPKLREVPFERCIEYISEQLYTATANGIAGMNAPSGVLPNHIAPLSSPQSNRSSGFWAQEHVWDCCHEVSAKSGEGVEEIFRVVTRKLVEQNMKRQEKQKAEQDALARKGTPGFDGSGTPGYFDLPQGGHGSFRVGHGDKRRSWLGALTPGGLTTYTTDDDIDVQDETSKGRGKRGCC